MFGNDEFKAAAHKPGSQDPAGTALCAPIRWSHHQAGVEGIHGATDGVDVLVKSGVTRSCRTPAPATPRAPNAERPS